MTRYDASGEEYTAADVLDEWELTELRKSQWLLPRPMRRVRTEHEAWDELGYSMRTGQWDPSKDGGGL